MRQRSRHGSGRRAARALTGGLLAGCLVVGAGVAGAAQQAADTTITTTESGPAFVPAAVSVNTGEAVTWDFPTTGIHNAVATNDVPADPAWKGFTTGTVPSRGPHPYTFSQPGSYTFVCQAHPNMTGTITVTGEPTDPPDPTPTPPAETPVPTPPPTGTPGPSGNPPSTPPGGTTPAPGGGARDGGAPAISRLRLAAIPHGARVTFRLSETATVTLRFVRRESRKVVRTARLQVRAGTRTVTVRGDRLRRGRYMVEVEARDGSGNRAPVQREALRIKRARG